MIYIVRDPRDVAVSFYYFALKLLIIADGYPMDDFVTRFLRAISFPLWTASAVGKITF